MAHWGFNKQNSVKYLIDMRCRNSFMNHIESLMFLMFSVKNCYQSRKTLINISCQTRKRIAKPTPVADSDCKTRRRAKWSLCRLRTMLVYDQTAWMCQIPFFAHNHIRTAWLLDQTVVWSIKLYVHVFQKVFSMDSLSDDGHVEVFSNNVIFE